MKAIIGILTIIGISIFYCCVLGFPFYLSWNSMPFDLPQLSWIAGSAMLFIVWGVFLTIYFAKAIGVIVSDGAKQSLGKH